MKNSLIHHFSSYFLGQQFPSSTPAFLLVIPPRKKSSVQAGLQRFAGTEVRAKKLVRNSKIIMGISAVITALALQSCTTVKEYEKSKLNDAEMVLGNRNIEKTELSFQSYREGSSGANAGKVGGGCGCN